MNRLKASLIECNTVKMWIDTFVSFQFLKVWTPLHPTWFQSNTRKRRKKSELPSSSEAKCSTIELSHEQALALPALAWIRNAPHFSSFVCHVQNVTCLIYAILNWRMSRKSTKKSLFTSNSQHLPAVFKNYPSSRQISTNLVSFSFVISTQIMYRAFIVSHQCHT